MREMAMRALRDAAYKLTVASRLPAWRRRKGAAIFAFHNVVPDDCELANSDRSLHLALSAFQDHLAVIQSGYTVVALQEIADRIARGDPVDGLAALTFDDAYRGVLLYALPLLARRGLPATVFVVSGAAAAPAPFWWDLLGASGAVPPAVRNAALVELRGDRDAVLERFPATAGAVPPPLLPATWLEVRAAARDGGVAIGSHTVTHRNLAALAARAVREELERARAEIGAAMGSPPSAVSYPYGLHNDDVVSSAKNAGYRAGVTMRFGLATLNSDPLMLPRVNVPAGISTAALECWAAGIRLRGAT
jgi:peptidoglycan/xylan/chitin deacetylase (PgdA/CDA1 family)